VLEQSVVSTVVVPPAAAESPRHLRDGAQLVRLLLRHRQHKVLFATAVGGAVLFAACTVVSSVVIGAITDHIIQPRFIDGHVDASTVVGLLGLLILVGVVRAGGVIVRRTWAGRTNWAVTESLTAEVIDRLVTQPAPWHRQQNTGEKQDGHNHALRFHLHNLQSVHPDPWFKHCFAKAAVRKISAQIKPR
jgi:ABC-type multidrug transport system fused ATPase/permease subunit